MFLRPQKVIYLLCKICAWKCGQWIFLYVFCGFRAHYLWDGLLFHPFWDPSFVVRKLLPSRGFWIHVLFNACKLGLREFRGRAFSIWLVNLFINWWKRPCIDVVVSFLLELLIHFFNLDGVVGLVVTWVQSDPQVFCWRFI